MNSISVRSILTVHTGSPNRNQRVCLEVTAGGCLLEVQHAEECVPPPLSVSKHSASAHVKAQKLETHTLQEKEASPLGFMAQPPLHTFPL